jgi:peptide/nickel transport system permease protein
MFGLIGLSLLLLLVVIGPLIAPYSPTQMDTKHTFSPPNAVHMFGTDDLGRDILSRVLYGGQQSLWVAFLIIAIAMSGGVMVGLVTGYYGGMFDLLFMRLIDILLAFPTILLLLAIVAALGPSLTTVMVAIAFSSIPGYSRLVRGSVLSAKNNDYVTAARVIGATSWRIMIRHISPNIIPPVIVYATLGLGGAIMLTAGLSYLGLGAQPPSPEWGAMLNAGRSYLREAWWMSVFPGLAIFWAVLCINLLGDGLRDALDPRLKQLR